MWGQTWPARHCAVLWSPPASPGTTSTLWREISTTDSSATTMIINLTLRYFYFSIKFYGSETWIISARRQRRTTVTTALLSWEKWCLTLGQSSQPLGSLFLPGVSLRWGKVYCDVMWCGMMWYVVMWCVHDGESRSVNLHSMPICALVVAVLSRLVWGLVLVTTTRKWMEQNSSSLFSHL